MIDSHNNYKIISGSREAVEMNDAAKLRILVVICLSLSHNSSQSPPTFRSCRQETSHCSDDR